MSERSEKELGVLGGDSPVCVSGADMTTGDEKAEVAVLAVAEIKRPK
jgi:hypothetical protein